jgi:hypothetical protein
MKIGEKEFRKLCDGIRIDREVIIKNNPIGSREEILLWMLLNCLAIYLSLADNEMPCFKGKPNAESYRVAILSVLTNRRLGDFQPEPIIFGMLD